MYRFIRESFRQNWTSNQIAYVKKNYRKLSLIIRDRKNELKENVSQRERFRVASVEFVSIEISVTSVLAFASISTFTFVSASIFTFVSASIFTFVFVTFLSLAESSNVQSTQQANVQRISKYFYFSTIYENRQYAQESNSQRINQHQHWSISQRNFIRYDDHQSSWYSKQSFSESSTRRQTYNQFESCIFCKKLIDLIKIYKEENKFKNKNDNFDFKIMIFYNKCNVIELFEHVYMQVASIVLEKRALSHFYSNRIYAMIFYQFCINIKRYFEESKSQCYNLNKWHFMHIRDIILTNSSLFLLNCLQKSCDDMNILQQSIDLKYHDSNYLRENLIRVCRDHFAFVVEVHNSSVNSSFLVDFFCISIVNWETTNKSTNHTNLQSIDDSFHDHYFTNRKYRREFFNNSWQWSILV
jgi:hypothetical protein